MKLQHIIYSIVVLIIYMMSSCKKEIQTDTNREFSIYLSAGNSSYSQYTGIEIIANNKKIYTNSKGYFKILLSRSYDKDIDVVASIDTSLLAAYEMMNNKKYNRIDPKKINILNSGNIKIKKGDTESDDVYIQINDTTGVEENKEFVVPVVIKNNNGLYVSKNRNIIYLHFKYSKLIPSLAVNEANNIKDYNIFKPSPGSLFFEEIDPIGISLSTKINDTVDYEIIDDLSLVQNYNSINNTSYIPFPKDSYKIKKNKVIILPNEVNSGQDKFHISVENLSLFEANKTYLLPIKIKNSNVSNIKSKNIFFIRTVTLINNIKSSNQILNGELIAKTNWSATGSSEYSSHVYKNAIDGNNSTIWGSNGMPAWIQIDMKSKQTVKGFSFIPNYTYNSEDILSMEILSSNDAVNWKSQGNYNGTPAASGTSSTNPDIKYVNFIEPVEAQFFKFNITKSRDRSYTGVGEINAFK